MLRKEDITGTWLLVARGHDNSQDDQMLRDRYGDNPLGRTGHFAHFKRGFN